MSIFANLRPGFFDHRRLVVDLRDTAAEIENTRKRNKVIRPPFAFLHRLGKDILHATDGDHGALALRRDAHSTEDLANLVYGRAFGGVLEYSWLIAAVIFARDDLTAKFQDAAGFSFEKALQWFVLHGVREHRLWHLISPAFLRQLTEHEVPSLGVTPLHLMVLRERPFLSKLSGLKAHSNHSALGRWLANHGSWTYSLFWCLQQHAPKRKRLRRMATHLENLATRSDSRERAKRLLLEPRELGRLIWPSIRPFGPAIIQDAHRRLSILKKLDALSNGFGRPLCFWSGMPGELAIVDGQHNAADHLGVRVVSPAVTIVVPDGGVDRHTIVLETRTEALAERSTVLSCRVNGRRAPVVQTSKNSDGLWIVDIPRRGSTKQGVDVVTAEAIQTLGGYLLSLQFGSGEVTLSRLWIF